MTQHSRSFEEQVRQVAHEIADASKGERAKVFKSEWWSERMMTWAMKRPQFKTQLFRFVDVFPAIGGHSEVLRHLDEYFDGPDVPKLVGMGLDVADHVPFGDAVSSTIAEKNITRMARQFIIGAEGEEAVSNLRELWQEGRAFTLDLLGEKTIAEADADRYAARVSELLDILGREVPTWSDNVLLERDDIGVVPRINVSVKPSALATHYAPLTRDAGIAGAKLRLLPLLRKAKQLGAHVHVDMEHYDIKDVTLQLFTELANDPEFSDLSMGLVIQAYLRDSYADLERLIASTSGREVPITIRLVKGAYWDSETVAAQAAGWEPPVWQHKTDTDANYEACVELLHKNHGKVRGAFASHNLRSLAYVIVSAREHKIPVHGFELQLLHGMAEPIHAGLSSLGYRVRVYAPVGDLVPGMAYLVRRLLENTSNESFVRARFTERKSLDALVAPPKTTEAVGESTRSRREVTALHGVNRDLDSPYEPEPVREWRDPEVRRAVDGEMNMMRSIVAKHSLPRVEAVVGTGTIKTSEHLDSIDPSNTSVVVATSASCSVDDVDRAVAATKQAQVAWGLKSPRQRAEVVTLAGDILRRSRDELIALEAFEGGRPRAEADAEICEAIDFCEYYAREAIRLGEGAAVQSPPGERNTMHYFPRGLVAVIAPWNFPLAIPTGMVVAALVMGNGVLFKPAEQTPAIAQRLVTALYEAGLPKGVLGFLPGVGEVVGARLVEHRDVHTIVFTGSAEVGLAINEIAARRTENPTHIKRVIAELGGKNAMIIDGDTDPDQAIPAVAASAFGYAGQKCSAASRLIVLDEIYDSFVERLVSYASGMKIGHAADIGTEIGPVIDADAYARLLKAHDDAPQQGRVLLSVRDVSTAGYFVGPLIVDQIASDAPLASNELFGPVLCVFRAKSFDEAIAIANDSRYALTAGLFSRSPVHIARASRELRAGNIYINRQITGAVVGRQPFGGFAMSGVGSKAGGPDYLLQFADPRVVSENTMRQGFVPEASD